MGGKPDYVLAHPETTFKGYPVGHRFGIQGRAALARLAIPDQISSRINTGMNNHLPQLVAVLHAAASKLGIKTGFIDAERRRSLPHPVVLDGISRARLGQHFERSYGHLKGWCRVNCTDDFAFDVIRDVRFNVAHRVARFADAGDAGAFRSHLDSIKEAANGSQRR